MLSSSSTSPTSWLQCNNLAFVGTPATIPIFGSSVVQGMQIRFSATDTKTVNFVAGGCLIINPANGQLMSAATPTPSADITVLSGPTATNIVLPGASTVNFMWPDWSGTISMSNLNYTSPAFGFGLTFTTPSSAKSITVTNMVVTIYFLPAGQTLPTTTTTASTTGTGGGGATTTGAPANPMLGIIIGAAVGGTIVLAGVVILIVYLVRRSMLAQPKIVLDAPLSSNYERM